MLKKYKSIVESTLSPSSRRAGSLKYLDLPFCLVPSTRIPERGNSVFSSTILLYWGPPMEAAPIKLQFIL